MTKRTPLHEIHTHLRASFTNFAGWEMPVRYGSEIQEHNIVRTTAGLFDLCHMGEIEITGAQAAEALDYALVSQPSRMEPGRARYSMICADDGGILDDIVVYRLSPTEFLIVANASNVHTVIEQLTARAAGFDAKVDDASERWSLIAVQGPTSAAIVDEVTGSDTSGLRYYAIGDAKIAGKAVLLARTGYTGEDGFEIYCAPENVVAIWKALAASDPAHGLRPAGLACRDTLRLEAGMPLYGNELDSTLTPFDAGMGRIVAFGKPGSFVGEEALSLHADKEPAHVMVGLVTSGRRAPRHGYKVVDANSDRQVGRVTSGAPSPTLGNPIAIAYVEPRHAAPGTVVAVDIRGHREIAEVVPLPFYKRQP